MRKKFLIVFLLFASFSGLFAQSRKLPSNALAKGVYDFGNNWYDSSLVYLKLNLSEDGIYRVSSASLLAFGWDTTDTDVDNYHLIYRGQEVPIHVEKVADSWLYFDFFGRLNDGRIDSTMYRDPSTNPAGMLNGDLQPNIRYSLFSDTSAYFLTHNNTPGLRVTVFSNTSYSSFAPENWFRYLSILDSRPGTPQPYGFFNDGGGAVYDPFYILNSDYSVGEGYVGHAFGQGSPFGDWLPTPAAANNGVPNILRARVYGKSTPEHNLTIKFNGTSVMTDLIFNTYIKTYTTSWTGTLSNTSSFEFNANGSGSADNNHFCFASVEYDRLFDLDGKAFVPMGWQKPTDAYFRFLNSDITSQGWVWDLVNNTRSQGFASADTFKVVVPGSPGQRFLFAVTDKGLRTPELEEVGFGNLSSPYHENADFVIITTRDLTPSAEEYEYYRDTCEVNPHQAVIVYVDEIYNEFGYGSPTTLAIKRFCKYAVENWSVAPKYFLLWGKGQIEFRGHPDNRVPTYGYPACDWEYVSNYDPFAPSNIPIAAVGRVNVVTNDQGMNYLSKLIFYEHDPWQPWMKEGVFLGGGSSTGEQQSLQGCHGTFMNYFTSPPLGGLAWLFQKMNNGIVTNSPLLSSHDHINSGVGLIHFFGHSSSNIQDVDIQEASLYYNTDKTPFMLAFGCYGGDFTGFSSSFGERWVLEPNKGAIGYLANSGAGYLAQLCDLGGYYYPLLYGSMLGQPIGDVLKQGNTNFLSAANHSDINNRNHMRQMNLQGDPAVILHSPQKPDLEITASGIYFSPGNFSASDTSFTMNVIVKNIALATPDSFYLSVRQQIPNGTWLTYANLHCPPVVNSDTFQVTIENHLGGGMAGLNYFDIFADSTNLLNEYSEINNRLISFQQLIPGNSPAILFPCDFAVIDSQQVTLAASSIVMSNQPVVNYIYEIDSSHTFSNPISSGIIPGTAAFSQWNVPLTLLDSGVYYWRVRLENVWPPDWATASFKYIYGKTGWGQSRPPQFFKDATSQMSMNPLQLEWEMNSRETDLHIFFDLSHNGVFRMGNGSYSSELSDPNDGVLFTPVSRKLLAPSIQNTLHGDWQFISPAESEASLIASIATTPADDYFFLCSSDNPHVANWSSALYAQLYSIGCDTLSLRLVPDGNKFIIVGRKGYPGTAIQITSPNFFNPTDSVWHYDLLTTLSGPYPSGKVFSTQIGPSVKWRDLIWDWSTLDAFVNEDIKVSAYAVRNDNTDSLVYADLSRGSYPLNTLDPDVFPFMRLEAHAKDSVFLTAPQLDDWYVIFDAAPDAAVDPSNYFTFDKDTVMEGRDIHVSFAARNLTGIDMDSLLIRYYARAENGAIIPLASSIRHDSLLAFELDTFSFTFNSASFDLIGRNSFVIELNPNFDQPEMYHFNNLYDHTFWVEPDNVNPLLDVTFNGKHLMDGDFISPLPEILIEINDENPFLAVSDTAYEVWFGPGTTDFNLQRIFLEGNPRIERVAPTLPENRAKIYYRPDKLDNGEYTLKVQGFDHNANAAGPVEYRITFNVENESAVTQVINYPNPFSTQTKFAYLLTGSEIPERFEIQIFTITGKLVKVVDLAGMNEIRFGYNITDFAWDGRDEYGDLLANGVYVYRVVSRLNGEEMKIRDEGLDSFFSNNGFGKMYIMR